MKDIQISKEQGLAAVACVAAIAASFMLPIKEEKVPVSAAPVASFALPESKLAEAMRTLAVPPAPPAPTGNAYTPTVTSVLLGHGRPVAVIDGKAVHIGESSAAGRVSEINEKYVVAGGRTMRLN